MVYGVDSIHLHTGDLGVLVDGSKGEGNPNMSAPADKEKSKDALD